MTETYQVSLKLAFEKEKKTKEYYKLIDVFVVTTIADSIDLATVLYTTSSN
jgi:hypothetical protein